VYAPVIFAASFKNYTRNFLMNPSISVISCVRTTTPSDGLRRASIALAAILGLVTFTGKASAAVFTNVLNGATTGSPFVSFGNAANPSSDSPKVGEVFSLTSAGTLSSFSFYAIGEKNSSLQLNVAQWNPDTNTKNQAINLVGPSLLTTTTAASETFNSIRGLTTIAFEDLGLNLNANTKYIAYLTSSDAALTGLQFSRIETALDPSGFGIGNGYLSTTPGTGWQLPFNGNGYLSLQYTAVVIPEPSTYAAILGAVMLGFATIRRRKVLLSRGQ